MQFVVYAYDATDDQALDRRMAARPDHLANIAKVKEKGNVICAGGLLSDEGKMKGSVLVLEFETREMLDEYLKTEPYIINKVWEKITVENFNTVILNNEKVGK